MSFQILYYCVISTVQLTQSTSFPPKVICSSVYCMSCLFQRQLSPLLYSPLTQFSKGPTLSPQVCNVGKCYCYYNMLLSCLFTQLLCFNLCGCAVAAEGH